MTMTTEQLRTLVPAESGVTFARRTVSLVLGNDIEIGSAGGHPERRVGIVPAQAQTLREWVSSYGLELSLSVLKGAGERAGFPDEMYRQVGGRIVDADDLSALPTSDVFHALKEPSLYERYLPRPFCRIGALHSGDFDPSTGFAQLLDRPGVTIFDGSNVGSSANFRKPIRGSMSTFAGRVAAEWVIEEVDDAVPIQAVIVGGGRVGTSALDRLLSEDRTTSVTLFDQIDDPERLEGIRQAVSGDPRVTVEGMSELDDSTLVRALRAANGLVLAPAVSGEQAPKILTRVAIQSTMPRGSVVVDVSIDERGAIEDGLDATWTSEPIIAHFASQFAAHGTIVYRAMSNMPRAYPKEASNSHGDAVLPYLAALLFLSARHDGAGGVTAFISQRDYVANNADPREPSADNERMARLYQDLRNGMALSFCGSDIHIHDIVPERDRSAARAVIDQHRTLGS